MSEEQEKIKELLEIVEQQERLKLTVLHNAVVNCLKDYQANSTTVRLNAWQSAETALKNFVDLLWIKYFVKEEVLANALAVANYLNLQGWRAGKSTVYKHLKEGKLRPHSDGSFLLSDVEKYAIAFLVRKNGSVSAKLDQLQKDRLDAAKRKEIAQARHWEIKTNILEGEFVPKDFFERELAKRAAVFKSDLENFARSESAGIINLVAGDAGKGPDLIEYMLARIGRFLERYAEEKEFAVPSQSPLLDDMTLNDYEEEEMP